MGESARRCRGCCLVAFLRGEEQKSVVDVPEVLRPLASPSLPFHSCQEDANKGVEAPAEANGGLSAVSFGEQVNLDSFTILKKLGKGSFGQVFKVQHKKTGEVFAVKLLEKKKACTQKVMRYTVAERNVLSRIRHPFIVSLHYAFQTEKHLILVLQYCPGGNLQELIKRTRQVQEPLSRVYIAEILLAICHLHEQFIVYRDLKPENVVLDEHGHAMLTDFGLSKEDVRSDGTRSFVGSLAFIAPEILRRRPHNHTVDIYGLGVLLFNMLTGRPPFYDSNRERLLSNIKKSELVVPDHVSEPASSLIESMMKREPGQRLGAKSAGAIKEHVFFKDVDWDALYKREVPAPCPRFPSVAAPDPGMSAIFCHSGVESNADPLNQTVPDWDLFPASP